MDAHESREKPRHIRRSGIARDAPPEEKYVKAHLVRVDIDPSAYIGFLDEIQGSKQELSSKYEFLYWTYWYWLQDFAVGEKLRIVEKRFGPLEDNIRYYLKSSDLWVRIQEGLNNIESSLSSLYTFLLSRLPKMSPILQKLLRMDRAAQTEWLEMRNVRHLVEAGNFAAVYRELRGILEDISWGLVNDLLLLNTPKEYLNELQGNDVYPLPFMPTSTIWWRISEKYNNTARDWSDTWNDCANELGKNFSYPLAMALLLKKPSEAHINEMECDKATGDEEVLPYEIPCINVSSLRKVLESMSKRGTKCVEKALKRVEAYVNNGIEQALPRYPTEMLVFKLLEALLGEKSYSLKERYDEYSRFIHMYDVTRITIPYSSVAEAAVLAGELTKFRLSLKETFAVYRKRLDSI